MLVPLLLSVCPVGINPWVCGQKRERERESFEKKKDHWHSSKHLLPGLYCLNNHTLPGLYCHDKLYNARAHLSFRGHCQDYPSERS